MQVSELLKRYSQGDRVFRGANLWGANLWGANLWGANLREADLRRANLTEADLKEADLGETNLRRADLRGANLGEANLWGADLRGANLRGADLRGANLWGANLRGADLRGANLWGANLSEAQIRQFKADFWLILTMSAPEVPALKAEIIAGQIDGSTYEGECCCLVGTLEKSAAKERLLRLPHASSSPAEAWFTLISPGDKPGDDTAGGFAAQKALEWLEEWEAFQSSAIA
ncbi:MAG: pentapeptide repeat-containing protein [Cyanobacteria bacterium J06648_11]